MARICKSLEFASCDLFCQTNGIKANIKNELLLDRFPSEVHFATLVRHTPNGTLKLKVGIQYTARRS